MNLSKYVLSKMCHSKEAAIYGITKFNSSHFEGANKTLYSVIKSVYKLNSTVDLHVLSSQSQAQGISTELATDTFHYSTLHTDSWENVFVEFKDDAIKRNIRNDFQELIEDAHGIDSPSKIASKTTSKALNWISDTEKRYYSGKEVDEAKEEYGAPILTGYDIYDKELYRYGGNLKGQMKGVILREKHGKTRQECWEVAQNLRMNHKVLYVTLEGIKKDITGNLKQILQHEWNDVRDNFFIVDGVVDIDEIESIILEAVLIDNVDKVVIDYIQLAMTKGNTENEIINKCTERLRHLMIKHNFHLSLLSQAKKESGYVSVVKDSNGNQLMPSGWKHVPSVNDTYGSMSLIKAASIILIGFRPNLYEENVQHTSLGAQVINPEGQYDSCHSLYLQTARTRYNPEYLHKWLRFTDGNNGLNNLTWL